MTTNFKPPSKADENIIHRIINYKNAGLDSLTDVYYASHTHSSSPLVLFLTDTHTPKGFYKNFAATLSHWGFVVLVAETKPRSRSRSGRSNSARKIPPFSKRKIPGILDALAGQNHNRSSPLYGKLYTQLLGIVGHSYGADVAVDAARPLCMKPWCRDAIDSYEVPSQLAAVVGISGSIFFEKSAQKTDNQHQDRTGHNEDRNRNDDVGTSTAITTPVALLEYGNNHEDVIELEHAFLKGKGNTATASAMYCVMDRGTFGLNSRKRKHQSGNGDVVLDKFSESEENARDRKWHQRKLAKYAARWLRFHMGLSKKNPAKMTPIEEEIIAKFKK